ncbi:MAG: hypothetical protein AAGK21_12330, partial [Bacteroidota bacterium]
YRVQLPGVGFGPVECLVHTDARAPFAVGDAVGVRAVEPAVVLEPVGAAAPGAVRTASGLVAEKSA